MFIHRFCSMIVLLGLLFLTLLGNNIGLAAYFVFGVLLSFFVTKEICEIFGNINILTNKKVLCIANTVAFIIPFFLAQGNNIEFLRKIHISRISFMAIPIFVLLLFIAVLIQVLCSVNDAEKLRKAMMNIAAFIFISFPVFLITIIYTLGRERLFFPEEGASFSLNVFFLYFILVTKSGDIGAYAIGTLCGKLMKNGTHKMIPSVSPGKSYEGLAGGIAVSVGLSYLLAYCFNINILVKNPLIPAISGLVLYFGGMYGDLVESSIKRTCKVKDSGKTIPGIGGIYDLLDSLFLSAPCFCLFLFISAVAGK